MNRKSGYSGQWRETADSLVSGQKQWSVRLVDRKRGNKGDQLWKAANVVGETGMFLWNLGFLVEYLQFWKCANTFLIVNDVLVYCLVLLSDFHSWTNLHRRSGRGTSGGKSIAERDSEVRKHSAITCPVSLTVHLLRDLNVRGGGNLQDTCETNYHSWVLTIP